ncbi:MAG: PilW family protein [Blastocatellia bacterium]
MRRRSNRSTPAQRGFTLIEMIVTLVVMTVVMGAVYTLLHRNQDTFMVEAARVDLHQNLRVAVEVLSRDVQAAGAGLPQFLGPISGLDGGTDGAGNPVLDASNQPMTDQLLLLYGDPAFSPLPVKNTPAAPADQIEVYDPVPGPAPAFVNGDLYILYPIAQANAAPTPDLTRYAIFRLQANARNATNNGTWLTPAAPGTTVPLPAWQNSYPAGALRVSRLDRWIVYRQDHTLRQIQRSVNGDNWQMVARLVSNLQFSYWIEPADPAVPRAKVVQLGVVAANNRAMVRAVEIDIRAETSMNRVPDGLGQRAIEQGVLVAPRNLTLPGFVINR